MNRWNWVGAVAVLLLGSSASVAQTPIYLVDMARIFKEHPQFNQGMEALKAEADRFQATLQQAQQQLMQLNEQLKTMDAASDEYRTREAEIAQMSANLEVQRRSQIRDLMQREAQLHFEAYSSISALVGQYCREARIPLVLRYSADPISADDPASIEQALNNNVVYVRPDRDITGEVLRRLTARGSASENTNENTNR